MKAIILLGLILLIGCSTPAPVVTCTNNFTHTIINNTREVPGSCEPCIKETCKVPDYSSYVKQVAKAQEDMRKCYLLKDILDVEYTACRVHNTTDYTDDLKDNYSICINERQDYFNRIGNITEAIQ